MIDTKTMLEKENSFKKEVEEYFDEFPLPNRDIEQEMLEEIDKVYVEIFKELKAMIDKKAIEYVKEHWGLNKENPES